MIAGKEITEHDESIANVILPRPYDVESNHLGHLSLDNLGQSEFYCSPEVVESFKATIQPTELGANEFSRLWST